MIVSILKLPISLIQADWDIVHGTWDAQSKFLGPYIAPHTNVTEIDLGLDLLWRAGVKPENVIMGFGWVSALTKVTRIFQDRSVEIIC